MMSTLVVSACNNKLYCFSNSANLIEYKEKMEILKLQRNVSIGWLVVLSLTAL